MIYLGCYNFFTFYLGLYFLNKACFCLKNSSLKHLHILHHQLGDSLSHWRFSELGLENSWITKTAWSEEEAQLIFLRGFFDLAFLAANIKESQPFKSFLKLSHKLAKLREEAELWSLPALWMRLAHRVQHINLSGSRGHGVDKPAFSSNPNWLLQGLQMLKVN